MIIESESRFSMMSKPASAGADGGVDVHPDDGLDVVLVHLAGARQRDRLRGRLAGGAADRPGFAALRMQARVVELDAPQCAVRVDAVGHVAQADHVALVPEARGPVRRIVGFRVDHGAERRLGAGALGARTVAMRRLPEPVLRCLRADLYRLEQYVVLRIARHYFISPLTLFEASNASLVSSLQHSHANARAMEDASALEPAPALRSDGFARALALRRPAVAL